MTNAQFNQMYNRIIDEMPYDVGNVERTFEENLECYGTCIPNHHGFYVPVEGEVSVKTIYTTKG